MLSLSKFRAAGFSSSRIKTVDSSGKLQVRQDLCAGMRSQASEAPVELEDTVFSFHHRPCARAHSHSFKLLTK